MEKRIELLEALCDYTRKQESKHGRVILVAIVRYAFARGAQAVQSLDLNGSHDLRPCTLDPNEMSLHLIGRTLKLVRLGSRPAIHSVHESQCSV